jgi:regulatory protein
MKITAIKAQVKRAGRYSIFVDEKYSFSLSDSALLEQKLTNGQEVSREDVLRLKELSANDKLFNQVVRYVALRPRSTYEIEQYLLRKHSPAAANEEILNKLRNLGFVNDSDFARSWAESRRLLKPISRRKLQLELRQKRITDEIIREVLGEDETTDRDTLKELIARKTKQTKYQDRTKLMQYLSRQGFGYDDIKSALQDTTE